MIANFTFLQNQNNYGQRLQNYALQRFMKDEFGETVVTLDYESSRTDDVLVDGRYFHEFEKECLNLLNIRGLDIGCLDSFDYIVIGGDQVLNTKFGEPWRIIRYLEARRAKKRNVIFYGAGIRPRRSIDRGFIDRIYPQVLAFGLREKSGDVDYVHTIDPVFLIYDKWDSLCSKCNVVGGTVTYNVHCGVATTLTRTDRYGNVVFSARGGIEVPDPRVFVGLFSGADKVVTNSFHGYCFSLINRVPEFYLDNPNDSRIASTRDMLGVKVEGGRVVNYDEVFENICKEKEKSVDFMSKCLSIKPVDYCAYSNDRATRDRSSSGGVAMELAREVLSSGGSVFGAAFSNDFRKVVPRCVYSIEEYAAALSKSKYSFCPLPDIASVKAELDKGYPVMYIGSPCHVRALKKLLGEIPPNLVCVDFRCRGYSSPSKLRKLVDRIEYVHKGKVKCLDFRPGHRCAIKVSMDNGKDVNLGFDEFKGLIYDSMQMCRSCPFAHGFLSDADITVADFWYNSNDRMGYGVSFTPEYGCNIVSVNTEKGRCIWSKIIKSLEFMPVIRT